MIFHKLIELMTNIYPFQSVDYFHMESIKYKFTLVSQHCAVFDVVASTVCFKVAGKVCVYLELLSFRHDSKHI